jgi:phosphoadenosine phosphosulfate reductase
LENTLLNAREVAALDAQFASKSSEHVLQWAWERFGARAGIGTSFQGAGLVMMHLAHQAGLKFPIFTLDTGLLFPETLELKRKLEELLDREIESVKPDLTIEQQAEAQGPALWNRDPDLCCTMRKVMPLQSKLYDLDCWLTGLRRNQSDSRENIGIVELYTLSEQTGAQIVKVNPMANWTREAIWDYIRLHKLPYNPLHDQSYRSIGCMTCTRKTGEGESERAGRWTGFKKVECGIHTFLSRKSDFQIGTQAPGGAAFLPKTLTTRPAPITQINSI